MPAHAEYSPITAAQAVIAGVSPTNPNYRKLTSGPLSGHSWGVCLRPGKCSFMYLGTSTLT